MRNPGLKVDFGLDGSIPAEYGVERERARTDGHSIGFEWDFCDRINIHKGILQC